MDGKFFIDVTQSCRSSNNSGIQVVTRNIYREISKLIPIVPITWDNITCNYSYLSKKELKNLTNPFSETYKPIARPNKQENPFYIELYSALRHSLKKIDFKKNFENRNIIFFPEVFRDKRVKYLQKNI